MSDEKPRPDIGKLRISIARSLRDVEQLALDLHAQALNSPNARDFPGGDALHMLAPAVVLQDWEALYEAKEAAERFDENGRDTWEGPLTPKGEPTSNRKDPAVFQGDDGEQPLNVLCYWTRVWREEFDKPTNLTPTISREVDFLRGQLDRICEVDTYGEAIHALCFEMQDELRTLVRRMEDVLHDGERRDYGVECLTCGQKLVKLWGIDPNTDRHFCEGCGLRYDGPEYAQALKQSYLARAEWLTSEDMEAAWRIPRGSCSSWASGDNPKVRKRIDTIRGRMTYNVADAKRERDRRNAEAEARDKTAL